MNVRKLTRSPWLVIGLAALGGWLLGSGVFALPFSVPSLGHAAPGAPASPAGLPASSSQAATIATSSGAMPAAPSAPSDPFAGWNI